MHIIRRIVRAASPPKRWINAGAVGYYGDRDSEPLTEEAPERIKRIGRFDIEFVEQPTPPGDIAGLRRVHERSDLPIVADEAAVRLGDVDRLAGACDGINVKLAKCGGIIALAVDDNASFECAC